MAEILTLTYEEAKTSDYINLMTTGVVLTGGASLLPGTIELAEDIFNMPAKLGTPSGFVGMIEEARKPQCATGVGLILYGLHHQSEAKHQYVSSESGMFDVIKKRFRRWFGSVTTFA
jgi:cell division protein FtsA